PATTPRPRCTSCTRPSWPGGSSCGGAWTWPSAPTRRATTGRRAGSRSADAVVGAGARSAPGSCVEEDVDGGRVPCRAQVVPEGDDLEALGGAREVGDAGQYGRVLRPADAAAEVLGGVPQVDQVAAGPQPLPGPAQGQPQGLGVQVEEPDDDEIDLARRGPVDGVAHEPVDAPAAPLVGVPVARLLD